MATRRNKINMLRETVSNMQQQLKVLENNQKYNRNHSSKSKRHQNEGLQRKDERNILSHTIRDMRAVIISNRDRNIRKQFNSTQSRNSTLQKIQEKLPHALKQIINHVDKDFYIQKPPIEKKIVPPIQRKDFSKTVFIGKRYENNDFGLSRENSKESKIKTFQQRKTDLIINPEKQKHNGIKIVRKIQCTNHQLLTQSPKSNSNLYFFSNKPIFIEKLGSVHNKNKSSLVLSPSIGQMTILKTAQSLEKVNKSQKKHFQRYTQQNLYSKLGNKK